MYTLQKSADGHLSKYCLFFLFFKKAKKWIVFLCLSFFFFLSSSLSNFRTCAVRSLLLDCRPSLFSLEQEEYYIFFTRPSMEVSTKMHLLELSTMIYVVRNQIKCVLVNERPRDLSLARLRDLICRVYQRVNGRSRNNRIRLCLE